MRGACEAGSGATSAACERECERPLQSGTRPPLALTFPCLAGDFLAAPVYDLHQSGDVYTGEFLFM